MLSRNTPVVLTIAGSDSGGEAGIQADLKTFAALQTHGVTAITCLTAQNPAKVSRLEAASPRMVRAQLESIAEYFPLGAAKTGMLFSEAIVREVVRFRESRRDFPLVVDPVMVSTSGKQLLAPRGVRILRDKLLPLATLVTPNLAEAEILIDARIRTLDDLRAAAARIFAWYGCAALVKGGHLAEKNNAVDFLFSPKGEWMFSTPRLRAAKLHGSGCTYSAAVAAALARKQSLLNAITLAKEFITERIRQST